MIPRNRAHALMILNALPDWGPINARRLLAWAAGDWMRVYSATLEELAPVVGAARARRLLAWPRQFDVGAEEARLSEMGAAFILEDDPRYPAELKRLEDAPLGLYWQGRESLPSPAIAIVGTRHATPYGRRITQQFTRELVRAGFSIVSGLALGIDADAHRTALEAGGATAAVLGHGLDRTYPPQNRGLFDEMRSRGIVISEFPLGRRPDRQSFPQRNRLVSGMSLATLVVETSIRGGSLITARFAMEQNRTVFAVPGRLDQVHSAGCHELIRDGATLVRSVDDILEELRFMQLDLSAAMDRAPEKERQPDDPALGLSMGEDERALMELLRHGDVLHPDQFCEATGYPSYRVHAALMILELQRLVVRVPGGAYEKR